MCLINHIPGIEIQGWKPEVVVPKVHKFNTTILEIKLLRSWWEAIVSIFITRICSIMGYNAETVLNIRTGLCQNVSSFFLLIDIAHQSDTSIHWHVRMETLYCYWFWHRFIWSTNNWLHAKKSVKQFTCEACINNAAVTASQ